MTTRMHSLELAVANYLPYWPQQRLGQAWFNVVDKNYPSIADRARGTLFDPFHDDSRLEPFLRWLQGELDKLDVPPEERDCQECTKDDNVAMPCTRVLREASQLYPGTAESRVFERLAERHVRRGHDAGPGELCTFGKRAEEDVETARLNRQLAAEATGEPFERVRRAVDDLASEVERERDALRAEVEQLRTDNKRLQSELDLGHEAYLVKDKDLRETKDELRIAKDNAEYFQGRLKVSSARIDKALHLLGLREHLSSGFGEADAQLCKVLRGEES